MSKYLLTSALPYANGYIHLGHAAGAYLPADIFARFLRISGEEVLYVCGSDEHGVATPENWTPGCKVIVSPPKTSQDLEKRLTEGYEMTDWYFSQKSL